MTTTINFKVPPELVKQLEAAAARKGISKTKYVRDVLIASLDQEESQPSMYELMKDSPGCFDGKPDLSTNSKHMKGYGKSRR